MALIGNYSVLQKSCAQFTNGTSTAGAYAAIAPSNYQKNGMTVNRFGGPTGYADHSTTPNGYTPPYSFVLAKKSGGLASYKTMTATVVSTDALLALGINTSADMTATISTVDAILALIVALDANLSADISVTQAQLAIILLLQADLTASGSITQAQLINVLNLAASASGSIATTANITNLVNLSANISSLTELSPENLAAAVLNALLAEYNNPGTVGEALNNIGAAGNPWSALLSSNTTAGTFGKHVQELLKKTTYIGTK